MMIETDLVSGKVFGKHDTTGNVQNNSTVNNNLI
jgi:hypothetical protein